MKKCEEEIRLDVCVLKQGLVSHCHGCSYGNPNVHKRVMGRRHVSQLKPDTGLSNIAEQN